MKSALEQISVALASAYPLTALVSPEEERLEALLKRFADGAKPEPLPVAVWNCVDGYSNGAPADLTEPIGALEWLANDGPRGIYIFKDLGEYLEDRRVLRALRDTAMKIRATGRYLFLLKQDSNIPDTLKPITYIVVSMFPDDSELSRLIKTLFKDQPLTKELIERMVVNLRGMSLTEAEHLLRRLIDRKTPLDDAFFRTILDEKEQIARKEGILDFVPPDESLSQLGGLNALKSWVEERAPLFTPEARAADMPSPKGVLLMGISGCGKSLAVKVIANKWQLPLFRLDMNLVFAGVHGSAEWIFHRALEAVEAVSPAVLWIDEIEMGIGGYSEGSTGAMTRIFSTFLTWMQEHRAQVFVAATANRINLLPAEILRKGRFDQVFFVDLPNEEERKEILNIHLARNSLSSADYDLMLLASATRNWNGAEIEQGVISARISAHARGQSPSQNDMLAAFGKIIPLSKTMQEQVKSIRSWARTRAVHATFAAKPEM